MSCKNDSNQKEDEGIKVGQVWSFNNRLGEDNATLQILAIDDFKEEGIIYHISISNLKVKNPKNDIGISNNVSHLPMSKMALENSLKELLIANKELPKFKTEYSIWKKAFLNKRAGVFKTPVKETINLVEQMLQERK